MKRWHAAAAGAVLLAVLVLIVWQVRQSDPAPAMPAMDEVPSMPPEPALVERAELPAEPVPPVEPVAPEACVEPQPAPLPPLAQSDAAVAGEVGGCVDGLAPAWIAQEDLLRRAAALLSGAAAGRVPRRQLAFMDVTGPFEVMERNGVAHLDPGSYRRYERFVDIVTCVPPGRAVDVIDRFEPLLTEALAALGDGGPGVRARAQALLERVLSVPTPPGFVPLTRPNVLYEYADPSLEALDDFQKQLLRMGPANLARLQDYARAVQAELERAPTPPPCP